MTTQPPDASAWASRVVRNTLGLAAWTVGHLIAFMGLVYLAGSVAGLMRYR